jgi:flagellar biosynthesis/type III secretory pathway protein FliH
MKSPFVFPTQIEPGSIADQLLKRGRQEGFEEGRQEGFEEGWQEGFEEGWQEGFEEGLEEARQEAMQEFEMSCIQILQESLGVPVESTSSLQSCSLDELRLKTADLRSQIQRRLQP